MKVETKQKWTKLVATIKVVLLRMAIKEVVKIGLKLFFDIDW